MQAPRQINLPTSTVPAGEVFTVAQLPAMRGTKLLVRLGKALGPAFSSMTGDLDKVAGALFSGLSPDEAEGILRELFATTKVGTTDLMGVFDMTMQGQFKSLGKLIAFALEVQFGDFFGDLVAAGKAAMGNHSEGSSTSPTSGPSTA